ncbi:MAG: HD domain-containing protein [Proteocatella sp.]
MAERFQRILKNKQYRHHLELISNHEKDRIFCKHDLSHFLDVARIAYILCLEDKAHLSKDLIYAAALVHDVGRHVQYEDGTPHEQASAELCGPILMQEGYSEDEILTIKDAVSNHRNSKLEMSKDLPWYIYRSDKLSRACYNCSATELCNWPDSKKNLDLKY